MSNEQDRFKNSRRRLKDNNAVQKQTKIAKAHGTEVDNPHKYHKRHAMDCGNPQCALCGNPRHIHKNSLTAQEKKLFQDLEKVTDRHSNGLSQEQP